jgi:hypothetical protein
LASIIGVIAAACLMIQEDLYQEALGRMPEDLRVVILQMFRDALKHTGGYRQKFSVVDQSVTWCKEMLS